MIVSLWSGPRNVSTALMYSFGQRGDTRVVDEPLYGHYLRSTNAPHPGREEVLAAMNCNAAEVLDELLRLDGERPAGSIVFLKNMAHHLTGLDLAFTAGMRNLFLIRDPRDMLPSLSVQLPAAELADTGLAMQCALLERIIDGGEDPLVIDSRALLTDPRAVLVAVTERLGIGFSDAMLHWPRGPRSEDGVWAKYWYQSVHASTGFEHYRAKNEFPEKLQALLDECAPYYQRLAELAIRV